MNMHEQYYNDICMNTSMWASPSPGKCGCRGSGWWVSDLDTIHACPHHYRGQPHPDDPSEAWAAWEASEAKRIEAGEPAKVISLREGWSGVTASELRVERVPADDDDDIPF